MDNFDTDSFMFKTEDLELEKIIAEINNQSLSSVELEAAEEEIIDIYDEDDEPKGKAEKARMELHDWVQCVVGAIIIGIVIFVFGGRSIGVDGISMMNTLRNDDRIVISNLFYEPSNGDILVFQTGCDEFGGNPLVKRVIAVAGQTVDIDFEGGHVFVDGILQCEPFLSEPTYVRNQFQGPFVVSEGHIFVMGDNRNHSSDSRDLRIGEVDTRRVLGRVLFIVIPGTDANGVRDWSRFGSVENHNLCPPDMDCTCDTGMGVLDEYT